MGLLVFSCKFYAQEKSAIDPQLVGGPCQGCEAVLDYGDLELISYDTLPEFEKYEPKIKLTGTVYRKDGVTPAKNVIIFIHQTNQKGEYPTKKDKEGWENQYGYIHAWVKTDAAGKYAFYTFKPGSYGRSPAHIHPIILEPNGKYYWLGSYFFSDDPKLTEDHWNPKSPRGGSNGIVFLTEEDGILVGRRDFILGKNIPDYD
jgi:protocatechuate 3,4-dioxygenase beta subunit